MNGELDKEATKVLYWIIGIYVFICLLIFGIVYTLVSFPPESNNKKEIETDYSDIIIRSFM